MQPVFEEIRGGKRISAYWPDNPSQRVNARDRKEARQKLEEIRLPYQQQLPPSRKPQLKMPVKPKSAPVIDLIPMSPRDRLKFYVRAAVIGIEIGIIVSFFAFILTR